MKKFLKIALASLLSLSAFVGMIFAKNSITKVDAVDIPAGQTLDTNTDTISVSDLTFDGLTNQSMIAVNENKDATFNYSEANTYKSLIFKFRYEITGYDENRENNDSANIRIGLDVISGYDKWDDSNSFMIRPDNCFLRKDKTGDGSSFTWQKSKALTNGTYNIEFGRVALFNEGVATGNYYVYYKVDGVEKDSVINKYDYNEMSNNMFINIGSKNPYNKVYDINLTHEAPQIISVNDLKKDYTGNTLSHTANAYEYDQTGAPANKSVVFVADWVNKVNDYANLFIGGEGSFKDGDKDVKYNWYNGGSISIRQDKVFIYKTDDNGYVSGNAKEKSYAAAMEIGADKVYRIEYGRLAIMNGTTFTGRYHVYFKLDGKVIYAIEQKLLDGVAAGGYFRIGNFDNDVVDALSYETPKQFSVAGLMQSKKYIGDSHVVTTAGGETFNWDNADHTANYSIDFKCKYTPNGTDENQFHFNKVDIWAADGSFIINRSGKQGFLGINGWKSFDYQFTVGQTYDLEYVRKAVLYNGKFLNRYYVALLINGTVVKEGTCTLADADAQTDQVFVSPGAKNSVIADIGTTTYETADEITISDLSLAGAYSSSVALDAHKTFTYSATAAHKSVVLTFNYEASTTNPAIDSQFHFLDGWTTSLKGGMVWLQNGVYIGKDSEGSQAYASASNPYSEAGTYKIELGKLYITGGSNTGKYYVYVKVNDVLKAATLVSSMPDKAAIFTTGTNGTVISDYASSTYEEADKISIGDLKLGGNYIGEERTIEAAGGETYTYDATAAHKSVILTFDLVRNGDKEGSQIHFNSGWLGENGGCIWLRHDKILIYKEGGSEIQWAAKKINWLSGKNRVEIGKLYITGGDGAGKYYLYVKVNGKKEVSYVITSMPDTNSIFVTKGTADSYYEINPTTYETADVVSISDLRSEGKPFGDVVTLNTHQTFSYVATAAHKSVVYKFNYETTDIAIDSQFHFLDGWTTSLKGGMIWLHDAIHIGIDSVGEQSYVQASNPFGTKQLYQIELGKLYIATGKNAGKYYIYAKVNGKELANTIVASMPDSNCLFSTGSNGVKLYDVDYIPVELDSSVYAYKWDVNKSGIQFTATFRKDFADLAKASQVGFVFYPANDPSESIKSVGKLVTSGSNYIVKGALAGLGDANLTREYVAKLYYVIGDNEFYSDVFSTSFYDELADLTGLDTYATALNAIRAKVLEVSVDEDTMDVVGAAKSGDASSIVLTGDKASYVAFILNGHVVANDELVQIGYNFYRVTLGANTITLAKEAKQTMFGGSEHFVELNSGHDDNMTAANLAPMTTELGLESVRLDIYFENLFYLTANNELKIHYGYAAKIQGVLDELKNNGGVNDFLAVLWTMLPYGYKTWTGEPWSTKVIPQESDKYLLWLQINGEAARMTAELFPEIHNFETWNEAEMAEVIFKVTAVDAETKVATYEKLSTAEKAKELTDLMYYYSKGIKSVNPDNVLTTPSLCCMQQSYLESHPTETRFDVSTYNFLKAMYDAINDDTPVTGYTTVDKDANNYFDVINVHPYLILGVTTDNWVDYVSSLNTLAASYGDGGTEVWVTEFGFAQNRYSTAQADMLTVLGLVDDVDCLTRFYFYKVHDYTDKIDKDRWGLYEYNGSIKAIGTAVKGVINPAN